MPIIEDGLPALVDAGIRNGSLRFTTDLAAARAQLAFVPYGHVAWSATGAMDEVLDRYAPYHGRMEFPAWVVDVYASTWQEAGR